MKTVLELPDELAAQIAARPDGKEYALAALHEAFSDEGETLDEVTITKIQNGIAQVMKGESLSIEEASAKSDAAFIARYGFLPTGKTEK